MEDNNKRKNPIAEARQEGFREGYRQGFLLGAQMARSAMKSHLACFDEEEIAALNKENPAPHKK